MGICLKNPRLFPFYCNERQKSRQIDSSPKILFSPDKSRLCWKYFLFITLSSFVWHAICIYFRQQKILQQNKGGFIYVQ